MPLSRYGGFPHSNSRRWFSNFTVGVAAKVLFDALHSFQGRGLRDAQPIFLSEGLNGTFGNEEFMGLISYVSLPEGNGILMMLMGF